ncbi:MAG TPA: NUDIX hydrolase [Candidatus Saccharimonadales bacterium]|nr:NUDIX hydrolase [Candidatus Saccharimonadales bacterium]
MTSATHSVSCKIAIYSQDGSKVLVMKYPQLGANAYGLPGGHLEQGENPDEAVLREFKEETGVDYDLKVLHEDFWLHENGKVVLGYIAHADFNLPSAPDPSFEIAQWQKIADIKSGAVNVGSYKDFVISNAG